MNNLKICLIILFTIQLVTLNAQSNFSMSMGAGTTHYYGSIAESDNISINSNIGGYYKFNTIFSAGLLFNHMYLKGTRLDDSNTPINNFNTTSNNLSLHLQFNIMGLFSSPKSSYIGNYGRKHKSNKKFADKFRLALDFGPGLMFYDTQSYLRRKDVMIPDSTHNDKGGNYTGVAIVFHLGGEVGYEIFNNIELFANLFGNMALSSDIDGYAYKYNQPDNAAANDFYYTTTVGLRCAIGSKRQSGSPYQYYNSQNSRTRKMQASGFYRYTGYKDARNSYNAFRR